MKHRALGVGYRIILSVIFVAPMAGRALAQQDPAVLAGVPYLRGHFKSQPTGQSAMIALALIKAEVPANDPDLQMCIERIRAGSVPALTSPRRVAAPVFTRRASPRWSLPIRTPRAIVSGSSW